MVDNCIWHDKNCFMKPLNQKDRTIILTGVAPDIHNKN